MSTEQPQITPPEAAMLLQYLAKVRDWVLADDPRAKRFIDAGAVRVNGSDVEFHRGKIIEMWEPFAASII